MKFTQTQSGASVTVNIKRGGLVEDYLLNQVCYQWGRKDPFPGVRSTLEQKNKVTYGPNADYLWPSDDWTAGTQVVDGTDVKEYVKYPYKFASNQAMDDKYYNLWSAADHTKPADMNTNRVIKTVYDPSPAGFCMPPNGAFSGFTATGEASFSEFNVSGAWDSGWHFYQNLDKTGETIYFPASGYRDILFHGGFREALVYGFNWSANMGFDENYGSYLGFFDTYIKPCANTSRGYGLPVRSVREF